MKFDENARTSNVKKYDYNPRAPETKEYVIEKSKRRAKTHGKTDKERLALEKKFYYRMMGK